MREAIEVGALLISAVIVCAAAGALADDPSRLGLPEVTVTTPPLVPQFKKWSPYLGNMRVEEDKWPTIPCASSRVTTDIAATCKSGPQMSPAALGTPQGASSIQILLAEVHFSFAPRRRTLREWRNTTTNMPHPRLHPRPRICSSTTERTLRRLRKLANLATTSLATVNREAYGQDG